MSASENRPVRLRGRFSPPFLPTFDTYFALFYLKVFIFCLFLVMGLTVLIDNLEQFDEFAKYADENGHSVWEMIPILVWHYAAYAPALLCLFMVTALPVGAAVIVITQASMNREFIVLRASGISMQRAVMPLLVLALAFGFFYTLTSDLYLPALLRKSFVMNNKLRPAEIMPVKITPLRDGENLHFVEMGHYDSDSGTAYNLRVEVRNREDFFAGRNVFTEYRARRAFLQPLLDIDNPGDTRRYQWKPDEGAQVTTQMVNNRSTRGWQEPLPTLVPPAGLERQLLTEKVMTWDDLRRFDDLDAQLEKHRRLSEPFVSFAMLMVVIPLILGVTSSGRQPSYITNAVLAVLACGVFYVLRAGLFSWGASEYLPPLLAAQGANLFFIALGGVLLCRAEG